MSRIILQLTLFICIGIQSLLLLSCQQKSEISPLESGERYMWSAPDSAYRILQSIPNPECLPETDRSHYALLLTQAMYRSNRPIPSDSLINIAVHYYSQQANAHQKASAYLYRGYVVENLGQDEEAMKMYKLAEGALQAVDDKRTAFLIYTALGHLYSRYALYENSIAYYEMALNLNLPTPAWKEAGTGSIITTIHMIKSKQPQYSRTVKILQEKLSRRINEMDFASQEKLYYQLALQMMQEKEWEQAASFMLQALEYTSAAEVRHNYEGILANIYKQQNKSAQADSLRKEALKSRYPLTKASIYRDIYLEELAISPETKAQADMQRYINELELLFTSDSRKSILDTGDKYNYQSLLHKNNHLHSRWSITILITIASVCILSLLLWISWRFFRRQRLEMLKKYKKEALVLQQQIDTLQENTEDSQGEKQNLLEQLAALENEKKNKETRIRQLETTFRSKNITLPIETIEAAQVYLRIISKEHPSYQPAADRSKLEHWLNTFHRQWADKLSVHYPALTNGEKDLCYLFVLSLSFNEVASLLDVQPRSVERNTYRICRKAGLAQSGKEEFMEWIASIDKLTI